MLKINECSDVTDVIITILCVTGRGLVIPVNFRGEFIDTFIMEHRSVSREINSANTYTAA